MRQYQIGDYVFVDKDGKEYISTPESDWSGCIATVSGVLLLGFVLINCIFYIGGF